MFVCGNLEHIYAQITYGFKHIASKHAGILHSPTVSTLQYISFLINCIYILQFVFYFYLKRIA